MGVIEPGTERAAGESQNKKVVVIGTEATVSSHAYLKALETRGIEAREKACPLLVPLVEEGWTDHPVTEEVAQIYLKEAFADSFKSADVLLLGCTHYPLIQPVLRRVAPKHVKIVDSADAHAVTKADVPEMLALTKLTNPGPFGARTHELGIFWHPRRGTLAAMAFERLRLPGFTEVSAVCTAS